MQNLLEELIQLLSEDERLVSEGKLLKNKVIELALNMDAGLIKLLLKNEPIKRHFFAEIGRENVLRSTVRKKAKKNRLPSIH
ncbi:MAG: hypothetical protein HZA12_02460 [Nitrospirae bacterium]|nr:hypothetical protein [Nitrospirota bacterium]